MMSTRGLGTWVVVMLVLASSAIAQRIHPTLDEMYRITRFDRIAPTVENTLFTTAVSPSYWTSTPSVWMAGENWTWSEVDGTNQNIATTLTSTVRCVR